MVGTPDPVLGQRVFGFVQLAPGARESVKAEILHNVADRLALYKVPEEIRVLDTMPRNALGKVDRRRLEAMAGEEKTGRSAPEGIQKKPLFRAAFYFMLTRAIDSQAHRDAENVVQ